jgi:hypothetical protein
MNVVNLSPAFSPKDIQRIRTSPAPFSTAHFSLMMSEGTLFPIVPTMEIVTPGTRINEFFVRKRLVPVPVLAYWHPEVGPFLSTYKTTLAGTSFKKMVVFAPLKKWIYMLSHNLLIE